VLSLDPAKVLVVLLVALVVLGPDKLPRAARQAGAAWSQLRQWRARLEEEVRGSFPDLPSTDRITQVVRSPLSFLDGLADDHQQGTATVGGVTGATSNGNGNGNGNGNATITAGDLHGAGGTASSSGVDATVVGPATVQHLDPAGPAEGHDIRAPGGDNGGYQTPATPPAGGSFPAGRGGDPSMN
jgi:Sec-independent protein translocase protein TatA